MSDEPAERPDWMTEVNRANYFNRYSQYENNYGEIWAFLYHIEQDKILLSGQDIGWKTKTIAAKAIDGLDEHDAIEQITVAAMRFGLIMHLEERMWLAACLRMAAETRRNYMSQKKAESKT